MKFGSLINNAGKGNYTTPDSIEKVIRYINRTNEKTKDDLITWGGLGITEFEDTDTICKQFKRIQTLYTRNGKFGRYIDHEYFSFSPDTEELLYRESADIDQIARKMAYDFYSLDHCQVVYAVHKSKNSPQNESSKLHIHFAVNTVNINGKKRRENMRQTKEREERFNKIISDRLASLP